MAMSMRFLSLSALLLAACASDDAAEPRDRRPGWPSLAPRADEVSPLVPRVPLGRCVGCSPDAPAAPPQLPALAGLPAIVEQPLPADAAARLTEIESEIARVEAEWPVLQRDARRAIAAAGAEAKAIESEAQASRFEVLFQPLGVQDSALAALEPVFAQAQGGDALAARASALRARLEALDAIRRRGL